MKLSAKALVLFHILQIAAASSSVNVTQCRENFLSQLERDGNPLNQTQVPYDYCKNQCGSGVGVFDWTPFSQNFSTWLLPWIALIFQLPFGADDRFDNLISVLLAVGSPALAGYSLAITRLNGRWLAREFADRVTYPNDNYVPVVFAALQHIPIQLVEQAALIPSLVVLPQNDQWWKSMARMARKIRQWNMPAAMNILWVTLAFLLTIVDSFADFSNFLSIPGDSGYALVGCWSFLLPLVVGWLHVGSQPEADHLRTALEEANLNASVATSDGPVVASSVVGRPSRAIQYAKRDVRRPQSDEKRSAPIFNYSRVFIWSQFAERVLRSYENASAKADRRVAVDGREWILSDHGVDFDNRIGTDLQVIDYCADEYSQIKSSQGIITDPEEPKMELPTYFAQRHATRSLCAPHVWERVAFAWILGLALQWGSAGAAVLIHMKTPPTGLGCRSLTFMLYGGIGTFSFFLMFASSILSHSARPRAGQETTFSQRIMSASAMLFRWLGKTSAVINGLGIIVASIMQFAGVYDNCFCLSNIFQGHSDAMIRLLDPVDVKGSEVYRFWIGGLVLAFGSAATFISSIYVASPMA